MYNETTWLDKREKERESQRSKRSFFKDLSRRERRAQGRPASCTARSDLIFPRAEAYASAINFHAVHVARAHTHPFTPRSLQLLGPSRSDANALREQRKTDIQGGEEEGGGGGREHIIFRSPAVLYARVIALGYERRGKERRKNSAVCVCVCV